MKKTTKLWLCISLALCVVGALGAHFIQTDFGKVTMSEISLQTKNGLYTGYLLVPKTATTASPAPAIVLSHGYLNNREMQDINYIELARRGYVVFVQNAFAHGESAVPVGEGIEVSTGGMVNGVEYVASLPFVDNTQIGVSGHSMGGGYTNATAAYYSQLEREALAKGASAQDAKKLNKIAAALIVGNYPMELAQQTDTSGKSGYLCHLGIIAGKYDEFYAGMSGNKGYELLTSDLSKNLVAVQTGQKLDAAVEEKMTYVNPENKYSILMFNPSEFHAQNHFSLKTSSYLTTFFQNTIKAPNELNQANQLWWLKEGFNLLGLIGFFAFVVPLVDLLLCIPYFAPLKSTGTEELSPLQGKGKRKFYTYNILGAVINFVLVLPLLLLGYVLLVNPFWPQDTTGGIGLWTLGSGFVCLAMLRLSFGKKLKGAGEELHTKLAKGMLWRTVVLAVCTVAATYSLVFLADYFLQTDFRIWTLVVRIFSGAKLWVAIKYLPLFIMFYVVNSLCISRNDIKGYSEAKKITLSVLFNILAPLLFVAVTYIPVLFTKATIFGGLTGMLSAAGALIPILVIPFVPILGIAAVLSYKLYKRTGSIWLGGFVNAMFVTIITVANTSFTFTY